MANIEIQSTVIGSNYDKVIDTEFKTFTTTPVIDVLTIDEFFQNYEDIFYQIPKEGDVNSHQYILNRTLEYLNLKLANDEEIQLLLDEITSLRRQLLLDAEVIAQTQTT
jgi:hypothetical protein